MKKTITALAITAALGLAATPAAFAQGSNSAPSRDTGMTSMSHNNQDMGQWFINGQVGQSNMDQGVYDDDDIGYQLTGGYRWNINPWVQLGIEGGYNKLGEIDAEPGVRKAGNLAGIDTQSKLDGWMLGANAHFNLASNWYLSARGGAYRWDADAITGPIDAVAGRDSISSTDWYAGAGVGYDFNTGWSVGLNYDYYRAEDDDMKFNRDMVSVSGEYRF